MSTVINRSTLEIRRGVTGSAFDPAAWLIDPDLSALTNVPEYYWKVVGDAVLEMSSGEKATVDATILATTRARRKLDLGYSLMAYMDARYPQFAARGLIMLQVDARGAIPPLLNRAAYVQDFVAWAKTILVYVVARTADLDAAGDLSALLAVTWDFPGNFNSTDPLCTLAGALAITD